MLKAQRPSLQGIQVICNVGIERKRNIKNTNLWHKRFAVLAKGKIADTYI